MPNKTQLQYIVSKSAADLTKVRIPGAQKPFEQMTISELVQLRPGSAEASNYSVDAITSDITFTTSKVLNELGNIEAQAAIQREIVATELRGPQAAGSIVTELAGK